MWSVPPRGWSTRGDGDGATRLALVRRQLGAAHLEPGGHRRVDLGHQLGDEAIEDWRRRAAPARSRVLENLSVGPRERIVLIRSATRRCWSASAPAAWWPLTPLAAPIALKSIRRGAGVRRSPAGVDEATGAPRRTTCGGRRETHAPPMHRRLLWIGARSLCCRSARRLRRSRCRRWRSRPRADGGQTYSLTFQILILMTRVDAVAGDAAGDDGVHAHHHRAVDPAPGARHGDHAVEPGADRAGAVPDVLRHESDARAVLHRRHQALHGRQARRRGGDRAHACSR